jgi:sialate O-acetylesterase
LNHDKETAMTTDRRSRARWFAACVLAATVSFGAFAQPKMPNLFGDHMVLQRGDGTAVFGTSQPGAVVTATVAGVSGTGTADGAGKFRILLSGLKAGGPHTLTVTDPTGQVTYTNVLLGDVYVASGQSNMEWRLNSSNNAAMEIADSTHATIRLFKVPRATSPDGVKDEVDAKWTVTDPTTTPTFSAVAYFFARQLQTAVKEGGQPVPIGLVQSAWGGTAAEAWTPRPALEADPMFAQRISDAAKMLENFPTARAEFAGKLKDWEAANFNTDPGDPTTAADYAKAEFDDSKWKTMTLPKLWEDEGMKIDGAVWFRREFYLEPGAAGVAGELLLPGIDDSDATYINDAMVGETKYAANSFNTPRKYAVQPGVLRAGKNVIAVRVFDRSLGGGFTPGSGLFKLVAGGNEVDLAGQWKYSASVELAPKTPTTRPAEPLGPASPAVPSTLYNAMIAPLTPMSLTGVIWYQGESNAGRAEAYRTLFPLMINQWREKFGRNEAGNELPFFWVQLANFKDAKAEPGESDWAELREAQSMTLKLPKTGEAVIIDIGEAKDIHPRNKQDVGKRLALAAQKVVYGQDVVYSGPRYKAMTAEGGKVRISFDHAAGLNYRGQALTGFAVAGADKVWHWAEAKVDGDAVVVSSPKVAAPVAVRYGWADNPQEGASTANLYNAAGLPASPFRTDDWPGVTVGKR